MAKRRFEWVGGSSAKFWETWIASGTLWTRHGRIGSEGTTVSRGTGSRTELTRERDQLVREKVREGYVETQTLGAGTATVSTKKTTKSAKSTKSTSTRSAKSAPRTVKKATATKSKPGATRGKTPKGEAPPGSEFDAVIARIEARAARAGVTLPPGASEQQIVATERKLERTLPAEVRAFYRRHDGGGEEYVVNHTQLLSLKGIYDQWKVWRDLVKEGAFSDDDGEPGPGVQRRWWIWEWVPITFDGGGNHVVVDLAPARGGTYGQMLEFWHDEETRKVVGKSLLTWLAQVTWTPDPDDE